MTVRRVMSGAPGGRSAAWAGDREHPAGKEVATSGYPAFKAAVSKGAGVIKQHLEMIDELAKKNGIAPAPVPSSE